LAHHHAHANGKTIANTLQSKFFHLFEENIASALPFRFVFKLSAHLMDFKGDILVILRELANIREILKSLLPLTSLGEPSWGLSAEEHTEEKDTARDQLQTKGNHPLFCLDREIAIDTVWNPESENSTNLELNLKESDKATADGGWRDLSDVDWDDEASCSDSPTSDDTTSVDSRKVSVRKCLDKRTNFEDCCANHKGVSSADFFSKREDHKGAEKATALETRDDIGRVEVDSVGILASKAEVIFEAGESDGATDEPFKLIELRERVYQCHNQITPSRSWS
jgi:hypothetical protein